MRGAWAEVELPPVPDLPRGRVLRPRFGRRAETAVGLAVATLLAWLGYGLVTGGALEEPSSDPARGGRGEEQLAVLEPEEPPAVAEAPRIEALSEDSIELRSGPVTLVLVTSRTDPAETESAGPPTPGDER